MSSVPNLQLTVLSLRYSSWSMRPWLALTHASAEFATDTVGLSHMMQGARAGAASLQPAPLAERRALGSVRGLFPVLRVNGVPIHESLAICEYAAEAYPDARLWPDERVARAQARAISCEMLSGFTAMRNEMSCHLFGRVQSFAPSKETLADVARVFEIWQECLARSGGPFLFGRFTIADAMFYPVRTRLRTYGVPIERGLEPYAAALDAAPAVRALVAAARTAPRIPLYDDYLSGLGGDPEGGLRAA